MSLAHKIIRNTAFAALGYFWGNLVSFFLTPYIISHIGLERYGVWSIAFVITGYMGLLDFGIGCAFTPYFAEAAARKDEARINQLLTTGVVFSLLFAVVIIALTIVLASSIVRLLNIPSELQSEAIFVLIGGSCVLSIKYGSGVFWSILIGLQRMDISNAINIVVSFPLILGTVWALEGNHGLRGLIVNQLVMALISSVASLILAKKLVGSLRFHRRLFCWALSRQLWNYGMKVQVSNLSSLVNLETDKIFISYFLNMRMVAFYELGSKITMLARSVPNLLVSALPPAASELQAKSDRAGLERLYELSSKLLYSVTIPLGVFIFFNSELLMLSWMGPGYGLSSLVIRFLILASTLNLLTAVITSVARGIGQVQYEMRSSTLVVLMNIPLSLILIIKFGFTGVLFGTTLTLIIGTLYYFSMFHRNVIQRSLVGFSLRMGGKPFLCSVLLGFILFLSSSQLQRVFSPLGRKESLTLLGLNFSIFFILYPLLLHKLRYFQGEEIRLLMENLNIRSLIRGTTTRP